eukprot:gene7576-8375_t
MAGKVSRKVGEDFYDHVSLVEDDIDVSSVVEMAKSNKAGAISTFFGTTRDNFEEKIVTHLEYEAYTEMALETMLTICDQIRQQWQVYNIVMQHKLGSCPVGHISVAIVISSAHRTGSLEALPFAINELKAKVPIWKKELYSDETGSWKENQEHKVPE